jgi:adenine/guanine/hypoxanthine permease
LVEGIFHVKGNQTTVRRELLAGLTTFMTMAYVVIVNPQILSGPSTACFSPLAFPQRWPTLVMGLWANYPIALAPGMSLNAYFTYSIVLGRGVPWKTALGVIFLSGVLFLLLTLSNIREQVVNAIPDCLKHGTAAGIGLFIAFIGLRNAKMIVANPATYVGFGRISDPEVLLAATGLVLISILMTRRFSSAILLGIAAITLAGIPLRHWPTRLFSLPHPSGTLLQLDLRAAAKIGLGELIFVFLFVDLFDNVGRLSVFARGAGSCEMGSFHAPAALCWLTPSGRCLARSRALPQLRVTSRVLPGWQPARVRVWATSLSRCCFSWLCFARHWSHRFRPMPRLLRSCSWEF